MEASRRGARFNDIFILIKEILKMKRIISLLIILIMVLTLAACGESGQTSDTLGRRDDTTAAQTAGETDEGGAHGVVVKNLTFQALLMYAETGNKEYFDPHVLNDAEKAQLKASVEAEGGKCDFDADGTIVITGSGSTRLAIHPDGSVEGTDDEGKPFGFSKVTDWPTSELGKAVPQADMKIKMQTDDGEALMIVFEKASLEQVKEYAKKLLDAGYTEDKSEVDIESMYSFSGKNKDGVIVSVSYMAGVDGEDAMCSLNVEKYREQSGDDTGYDTQPLPETELPAEFAFLLPDGKKDFKVVQNYGFTSIEKENATLGDAKNFASLCEQNGYGKLTGQEYDNGDGTTSYFAAYQKDGYEIHISFNVIPGEFHVDLIETSGQGDVTLPSGDDEWPTAGAAARLPKPTFGTGFTVRDYGDSLFISVEGAGASDFGTYVNALKSKGFTDRQEYDDDDEVKLYSAYDKDNYAAFVQYAMGVFGIGITNQPEED